MLEHSVGQLRKETARKVLWLAASSQDAVAVAFLESQGYEVKMIDDAVAASRIAETFQYIVVDSELDAMAIAFLKTYRLRNGQSPVIVIGPAQTDIQDCRMAFRAGADDFVRRPFEPEELLLRLEAISSRRMPLKSTAKWSGTISLDYDRLSTTIAGTEIVLTRLEFDLLEFLLINDGRVVTPEELLERVWKNPKASNAALRTCLRGLRSKFERVSPHQVVKNVHGIGYTIQWPVGEIKQAQVGPVASVRPPAELMPAQNYFVSNLNVSKNL